MGEIRTERIYESVRADSIYRILVDRLWPRGISKEKAAIDEWWKDIAPSAELRKWFNHDPAKYDEFKARYLDELARNEYAADCKNHIGTLLEERDVILLYAAKDMEHNNAVVLKEWFGANTKVTLVPLWPDDREQFILDNQEAFRFGAMKEFGLRNDHFEEDGEIISHRTIEGCIDGKNRETYRIVCDGEAVGGLVLRIDNTTHHNELEILFVSPKAHSRGIGYAAWLEVEK